MAFPHLIWNIPPIRSAGDLNQVYWRPEIFYNWFEFDRRSCWKRKVSV